MRPQVQVLSSRPFALNQETRECLKSSTRGFLIFCGEGEIQAFFKVITLYLTIMIYQYIKNVYLYLCRSLKIKFLFEVATLYGFEVKDYRDVIVRKTKKIGVTKAEKSQKSKSIILLENMQETVYNQFE
ncbi:MAG: hypothetical protein ACOY3U_05355 [Bacillota bacterium]